MKKLLLKSMLLLLRMKLMFTNYNIYINYEKTIT